MAQEDDPLLTTVEVAKLLDMSPATLEVWRSTKRHHIPYVKIGRNVRYRQSAAQKFIDENTK